MDSQDGSKSKNQLCYGEFLEENLFTFIAYLDT